MNVAASVVSESREITSESKTVTVFPGMISTETVRVGIEQRVKGGQLGLLTEILTARGIVSISSR